jgi:hypothetical protein
MPEVVAAQQLPLAWPLLAEGCRRWKLGVDPMQE